MVSLADMDFTRYGFHVQHRANGFDLAIPEATEAPLFRCVQDADTWLVHMHGVGLRELYHETVTAEAFLQLLDLIIAETAAYLLPANLLGRYLYFLNQARLQRMLLNRENIVMLTTIPVPFKQQARALQAQGKHDIFHVIKAAELNDDEFQAWQAAFDA